ncbi:MAG: hypothetical protein J5644_06605 [Bacteroidales bacterium]|nr:hypothetical protein [Bacteroidales bacterium]
MTRRYLILISLLICCFVSRGQKQKKGFDFRFWEDSLISLREQVMNNVSETERLSLNEDFMYLLEKVLQEDGSFKFPWDSVRNFSIVTSPDKLFRCFTWYVLKDDYSYENYGLLQVYSSERKHYMIIPLYDKRYSIDYPKTYVGNHNRWYGAVYYKVIPLESGERTYYTLLGWNGNDIFTNEKIIEVLHFKNDMTPVFGANIFKKYPEKCSRVILSYSKNATMSLNYEYQSYNVGSGKRDPKTKQVVYDKVFAKMIVFDELVPLSEEIPDLPSFRVPESSLNQGFVQDKGKWLFVQSVNRRNPDKPLPEYQHKNRQIYVPNP